MRIFIGLMMLANLAQAGRDGQVGGNGGGGICLANRCMTLAEAGFRIPAPSTRPELSQAVMAELENVIAILPKGTGLSRSEVVGRGEDVQFISIGNERSLKQFLNEYRALLKENNYPDLSNKVELLAFTAPDKTGKKITFLLVEKFERLSVRSQALLLIHESMLRNRGYTLSQTLAFDGAAVDYLAAAESGQWNRFDTWNFARGAFSSGAMSYMIGDILSRTGPLSPLAIFSDTEFCDNRESCYRLDYAKILENRKLDSRFSAYFAPRQFSVGVPVTRSVVVQEFLQEFGDNWLSLSIDDHQFSDFLKRYAAADLKRKAHLQAMAACGNASDQADFLYAEPQEGPLFLPKEITCVYENIFPYPTYQPARYLVSHIQGMKMEAGTLVCTRESTSYNSKISCQFK